MRTPLKRNHPEAGVALIIALLTLLILSVLAASIIFVTQTETWATANNRSMVQARYAAEAGAEKTLNWLRYTYLPRRRCGSLGHERDEPEPALSHWRWSAVRRL